MLYFTNLTEFLFSLQNDHKKLSEFENVTPTFTYKSETCYCKQQKV